MARVARSVREKTRFYAEEMEGKRETVREKKMNKARNCKSDLVVADLLEGVLCGNEGFFLLMKCGNEG